MTAARLRAAAAELRYVAEGSAVVNEAVAAWLEHEAREHERTESRGIKTHNPHAHAVAYAIVDEPR